MSQVLHLLVNFLQTFGIFYSCDIPIGDIQCGEEKCVALTLVLPRLMEEKLDTVLKGTLSYFDTGLAEDRSEHFQLNISRAGTCLHN